MNIEEIYVMKEYVMKMYEWELLFVSSTKNIHMTSMAGRFKITGQNENEHFFSFSLITFARWIMNDEREQRASNRLRYCVLHPLPSFYPSLGLFSLLESYSSIGLSRRPCCFFFSYRIINIARRRLLLTGISEWERYSAVLRDLSRKVFRKEARNQTTLHLCSNGSYIYGAIQRKIIS